MNHHNSKVWIVIGVAMIVIGVVFSAFFSYMSEKQLAQLVQSCEQDGGQAIVEKSGFIITTSFQFECKK